MALIIYKRHDATYFFYIMNFYDLTIWLDSLFLPPVPQREFAGERDPPRGRSLMPPARSSAAECGAHAVHSSSRADTRCVEQTQLNAPIAHSSD